MSDGAMDPVHPNREGDAGRSDDLAADPATAASSSTQVPASAEQPAPPAPPPAPVPTGWAAYIPAQVAPSAPAPAATSPSGPAPSLKGLVNGTFELVASANRELRHGSLYVATISLAFGLPVVLVAWAALVRHLQAPDASFLELAETRAVGWWLPAAVALAGYLVLVVDAQVLALVFLAARRFGQPLGLHEALRVARGRFWLVVRSVILIFLILIVPSLAVGAVVQATLGNGPDASFTQTLIMAVVGAPYAYVVGAATLAETSARGAIRLSVRLARRRWRLAVLVAVLVVLAQLLVQVAAISGVGVLFDAIRALHLFDGAGSPPALTLLAGLVLGVAALGALLFGLSAAAVAPQVVALCDLAGLPARPEDADLARDPAGSGRLVSLPMAIGIGLAAIASLTLAIPILRQTSG